MKSKFISNLQSNIPIIFITLAWSGFIFALIGTPMEPSTSLEISYSDKFIHFLLFGIEAELVFLSVFSLGLNKIRSFVYGFIISFGFALFSEYFQSYVPGRLPSELDLLAGIIGMLFFTGVTFKLVGSGKPKLLLHICCAGCGAYSAEVLAKDYDVYLLYSNSNLFPAEEFEKRKEDVTKISNYLGFGNKKIIFDNYEHNIWLRFVKGLEGEKEGGARCRECFKYRFSRTAQAAQKNKIKYFTSTLSVSPHKNVQIINEAGLEIAQEYNLIFLPIDLKKDDGFKKSIVLSKKLELYRQNYCGCEFSIR